MLIREGERLPGGVEARFARAYKLAHRVWSYDTSGNFMGTIHLSETLTVGEGGQTHSGSFTLDFYDPSGTFQFEVAGSVPGDRISVE